MTALTPVWIYWSINKIKSQNRKEGIQQIKARLGQSLKKKWESKVPHGQCNRSLDRQLNGEAKCCMASLSEVWTDSLMVKQSAAWPVYQTFGQTA